MTHAAITFTVRTGRLPAEAALQIRRSNGAALSVTPDRDFSPFARGATREQRDAYLAALAVLRRHGKPVAATSPAIPAYHQQIGLANGWTVCANRQGGTLYADGLAVPLDQPLTEP